MAPPAVSAILEGANQTRGRKVTDDTEGLLIANACLVQGLIAALISKKALSPAEVTSLVGEAEGYFAGLSPSLMTPRARGYARDALQAMGKIFSPPPR